MVNRYCGLPALCAVGYPLPSFAPLQTLWPASVLHVYPAHSSSGPYYCFSFCLECIPPTSIWLTSTLPSDLWANVISGEIFLNHPIYDCSLCLLLLVPFPTEIFSLAPVTIWQAMDFTLCFLSVSPSLNS